MGGMSDFRAGLGRAWESAAEGWRQLVDRASGALTFFRRDKAEDEPGLPAGGPAWGLMAADVEDRDDHLLVRLEAPGMDKSDFDVRVTGDYLVVGGSKSASRETRSGRFYRMERAYGRFERAIPLPVEVDRQRSKARYRRGVLEIELPKARKGRVIDVSVD